MRPGIWLIVVFVIGSVVIGAAAYQAGIAHATAEAAVSSGASAGAPQHVHFGGWHHPWGFGFVFPFFFLFFWIFVARAFFWGGPWRYGWHAPTRGGVPPMFDEWHRRSHEQERRDGSRDRHREDV